MITIKCVVTIGKMQNTCETKVYPKICITAVFKHSACSKSLYFKDFYTFQILVAHFIAESDSESSLLPKFVEHTRNLSCVNFICDAC